MSSRRSHEPVASHGRRDRGEQDPLDLLPAVMHEMGHVLGLDHDVVGVMQDALDPGTRWAPSLDAADDFFAALGTRGKE
jgi:hypothetical protein